MSEATSSGICVKMFVGIPINSEVRMHLKYSDSWQQQQVLPRTKGEPLQQLRHDGKEYVGMLLEKESLTLPELRELEDSLREGIREHCPELNVQILPTCVVPQLFLS